MARFEVLEDRILLSAVPGVETRKSGAAPSAALPVHPAAMTAYLPHGASATGVIKQLVSRGGQRPGPYDPAANVAAAPSAAEIESNDTIATANPIDLGFDATEQAALDVSGTLTMAVPTAIFPREDDGSITRANATVGLVPGAAVKASAEIGDGPFGGSSGDYDFYSVPALAGARIVVDVDAETIDSLLDPVVAIYDVAGNLLDSNDDAGGSLDSFLSFTAPADGVYFVAVLGFGSPFPPDPFDSSSGTGAGSIGPYDLTLWLDGTDQDFFLLDLEPGDILGANVGGGALHLTLRDPDGVERMGSGQELSFIHPAASPLPGGGNAALSWVVDTAGPYTVAVDGGSGDYELNLRLHRPALTSQPRGEHQVLFVDFDGASLDTEIFGQAGLRTLSPLASFLDGWGLEADDEDAVIDAILATVEENFADVGQRGHNGNRVTDGVDGHYEIEILNSRDQTDLFGFPADPFGQAHVSRVIVGGTIEELGISTIGLAESIDVGNFETEETAVVLLDLLSAPAADPNSLNQFERDAGASIIDLIGVGVGNIVTHEAGHLFGNWHTDQLNLQVNLMDQGGFLDNTIGVGPNRIFEGGGGDDVDVDFGVDTFVPNEGFTGTEDTLNVIAFGLSSGTEDVGMFVVASDPAAGQQRFDRPTDFLIEFSDPYDVLSIDPSDLTVNGVGADRVLRPDDNTLNFRYDQSPVTASGRQTMAMAADAILRVQDGDGVAAFSAEFGFDAVPTEIVSVAPAGGALVELPFTRLALTLNEAYDPASVDENDLTLSQGRVTGFELVDATTIAYDLADIRSEGRLTVTVAPGALRDFAGNLVAGTTVAYQLDFGQVAFPVPLSALEPAGGLIYAQSVAGTIDAGDEDRFALTVDPGQTLTLSLDPASTLQGVVELRRVRTELDASGEMVGPGVLLERRTAVKPGDKVVMQTIATPGRPTGVFAQPQVYLVTVSATGETVGAYSARIVLNAATEMEEADGLNNDSVASARDLESAFIPLGPANAFLTRPERAGLLGQVDGAPADPRIAEVEPNEPAPSPADVLAAAQPVDDAGWNLENNVDISESTRLPHVTIEGSGDGTFDYFSFTVTEAGERGIFDIDDENFDTELFLYDAGGNLLAANDDSSLDSGSGGLFASLIDFTFSQPGTYVIGVGEFNSLNAGGQVGGNAPDAGDEYSLHLSLGRHPLHPAASDPVPESEPNDRRVDLLAAAQNLDGAQFSISADPEISLSTTVPHVSIAGTGDGTLDYYAFTVPGSGARGIFDIDGANFDADLYLFDGSGRFLEYNDSGPGDLGDGSAFSAYIDFTFTDPGAYLLAVADFDDDAPGPGDQYVLHVSLEGVATPVLTADVFGFDLEPGESATLTVAAQETGHLELALLDAGGQVLAESAEPSRLVTNGSFETGDFTGWTVETTGVPFGDWQVSEAGQGGGFDLVPTSPQDGTFVAWNGFDGIGPMQFAMYQDVAIPADAPAVRLWWQDRVQWNFTLGAPAEEPRLYDVQLRDPETDVVLETLYSFSTGTEQTNPSGDTGWQTHTSDVSAYRGAVVRLYFLEQIPELLTGPGQVEFDAIRLSVSLEEDPANVNRVIRNFVATRPGTYFARVQGDPGSDYALVITRNADFGLEDNGNIQFAQTVASAAVDGTRSIAGAVDGTPGDLDFYQVMLSAQEPLVATTATPAEHFGQFVNPLDPVVRLYDADGNLVAVDDNSAADERNAWLSYTAAPDAEGTYFVAVSSSEATAEPTAGDYILSLEGHQMPPTLLGDANNDGQVTGADLIAIVQNFGHREAATPPTGRLPGDADDDGHITGADLIAVREYFGAVFVETVQG